MAATVINSAQGIQTYQQTIQQNINDLKEKLSMSNTSVDEVGKSWQDQNFIDFKKRFDIDKEQIDELIRILNEYEGNILETLRSKLAAYEDLNMILG